MSKDIELRHILPNGHRSSSSSDKMSGSGSFHSSSPHDASTDMVSAVPPVYSTVPEAQSEHSRYNAQQVKNAHAIPQTEYASPVGMDPPNEYDMIPDNNKRRDNRSLSPGVAPLMAENVLYGTPVDEKLKHRSLTMEKANSERQQQRKFTGSMSSQVVKEPADGGAACTGKCCGVILMLVLVFVVALLAVAALVLVLSIMFQIYPVCDCTKTQEFQVGKSKQALQTRVDQLMSSMPTQAPEDSNTQELIRSVNSSLNSKVDALRSDVEANLTRINDGSFLSGTNFSSTLSGVNVFESCETRIEEICNISVPRSGTIYPTPCSTPEVASYVDGKYTLDIRCIRASVGTDGDNALVAFLSFGQGFFFEDAVQCHCHVVIDNTSNRLEQNVTCGIQITRCASSQTLNITTQL